MQVTVTRHHKVVYFKDIHIGECFVLEGIPFVRIARSKEGFGEVLRLGGNQISVFSDNTEVVQVIKMSVEV